MSGTKIVVVVLVLVVVLFVVLVVWGAGKNLSEPAPSENTFHADQYPTMGLFNDVLARFGPKFEVNQLQPPVGAFDLRTQPVYNIKVLGDSKHKFRQAKFLVQPSKDCAIVMFAASGPLPDKVENPQESRKSNDAKHPNEFTFTIFEGGGTLKVSRDPKYAGPCKVTLE